MIVTWGNICRCSRCEGYSQKLFSRCQSPALTYVVTFFTDWPHDLLDMHNALVCLQTPLFANALVLCPLTLYHFGMVGESYQLFLLITFWISWCALWIESLIFLVQINSPLWWMTELTIHTLKSNYCVCNHMEVFTSVSTCLFFSSVLLKNNRWQNKVAPSNKCFLLKDVN